MDNKRMAHELVKLAKAITAKGREQTSGKAILDMIRET